jgi:hypothetical protein
MYSMYNQAFWKEIIYDSWINQAQLIAKEEAENSFDANDDEVEDETVNKKAKELFNIHISDKSKMPDSLLKFYNSL